MSSRAERPSKIRELEDVLAWVEPGCRLAFGGFLIHNKPSTFVRALVRAGIGDLHLYSCPTASYDVDLLIGAGLVTETVLGNVSFDYLGPAPQYSAAVAAGSIDAVIADEAIVAGGYMATIEGIPYHPLESERGHDVATSCRLVTPYRSHTGHDLVAVSPIAPDVAVLHVQQADPYGNCRHLGSVWGDVMIAKASRRVIVTTDELITEGEIRRSPRATTLPGQLVDAVVVVPHGAHPCSSHGRYLHDEAHLRAYLEAGGAGGDLDAYLERYVRAPGGSQAMYLEAVGGEEALQLLEHRLPW